MSQVGAMSFNCSYSVVEYVPIKFEFRFKVKNGEYGGSL